MNRSLWDFITDNTTRTLYRQMMAAARCGRPIEFTFNCDSPTLRRTLRMQINGVPDGTVLFRTQLVKTEARDAVPVSRTGASGESPLILMCSWCKRVSAPVGWVEPDDAVRTLGLFRGPDTPRITHGTCEDCYHSLISTLKGSASAI